ncbi:MAG: PstS family phosphate ABC transporter substrate-binding protein [Actinomycetota bacterium]
MRTRRIVMLALPLALFAAACNTQGSAGGGGASGTIEIDGSSTVFPISEAIAEEFGGTNPEANVRVGQSGTGGGFEKFCNGEVDISDASRPIKDEEKQACDENGVGLVELKVAIDGLSVVVNPENTFAECLTTTELKSIWEPGSSVQTWRDVRDDWPAEEIKLYGPGADSGTFDYFTGEVVGEEGASRSDYTQSEDDNVLVQGVAGDTYALGYFGYAYYKTNDDEITALGIDSGDGCVAPTDETIKGGDYTPLSRPLYIYVSSESLGREAVAEFTSFYLDTVNDIISDVGYIELPANELSAARQTLEEAVG